MATCAHRNARPDDRCYWVIESLLLGGAYPESPLPAERGRRIEDLWRAGIRTFVSLVEERKRSPSGDELVSYVDSVRRLAVRTGEHATCVRLPIRDLSVPSADAMRTILDVIDLSLQARRPVYVHCLGGVGRTGTVIGTWLRRHRLAKQDDVQQLRRQVPGLDRRPGSTFSRGCSVPMPSAPLGRRPRRRHSARWC